MSKLKSECCGDDVHQATFLQMGKAGSPGYETLVTYAKTYTTCLQCLRHCKAKEGTK